MTNDVARLAMQFSPRRTRHNAKRQGPAGIPGEIIGDLGHSRHRFTVLHLQREAQAFLNLVHYLCEEFQTVAQHRMLAHVANSKEFVGRNSEALIFPRKDGQG
jgi:hypothetical protein